MNDDNEIPAEHVLPFDFVCGHVRFRKGVRLETVRQAAERWRVGLAEHYAEKRNETALAQLRDLIGPA